MEIRNRAELDVLYPEPQKGIVYDSPELLLMEYISENNTDKAMALFQDKRQFSDDPPAVDTPYGRFEGKEKTLVIGPYPEISLTEARARQSDARMKLLNALFHTFGILRHFFCQGMHFLFKHYPDILRRQSAGSGKTAKIRQKQIHRRGAVCRLI